MMTTRLRLALQKKGRLAEESLSLLRQCGLQFRYKENALLAQVDNFPIDLLFVRDDDIPGLIFDGICDAGIVGENVLFEKTALSNNAPYKILSRLNRCTCRLAIAVPLQFDWQGAQSLMGMRIATSYPNLLSNYLTQNELIAECIPLSGSVEMAPRMGMSDVICDLVSTGQTLEENKLIEVDTVLESQASFIQTSKPV